MGSQSECIVWWPQNIKSCLSALNHSVVSPLANGFGILMCAAIASALKYARWKYEKDTPSDHSGSKPFNCF